MADHDYKNGGWKQKYIILKNRGRCERCEGQGKVGPTGLYSQRVDCPDCKGFGCATEPVSPEAIYFVLRLDEDPNARVAALAYADSVEAENLQLAHDIRLRVAAHAGSELNADSEPPKPAPAQMIQHDVTGVMVERAILVNPIPKPAQMMICNMAGICAHKSDICRGGPHPKNDLCNRHCYRHLEAVCIPYVEPAPAETEERRSCESCGNCKPTTAGSSSCYYNDELWFLLPSLDKSCLWPMGDKWTPRKAGE